MCRPIKKRHNTHYVRYYVLCNKVILVHGEAKVNRSSLYFFNNFENIPEKGGCQVTALPGIIMKKLFKSNVNSLYSFVVYEFSIRDEFDKRMLCKLSFGE